MLEVTHLSKNFGSRQAVVDLTMNVGNELLVFLGPNGAGKTTSIKMMTGLLKPSTGAVTINGFDIQKEPLIAKRFFGLVQEEPVLYEKLRAREFITFLAKVYGVPPVDAQRRMEQLLEIFEMTDRADDLIEDFSHGMKQKVALIAAMVHDPQVLFLDEPTVGLDPKASKHLKDILRGLVDRGKTVFMSTHILEVAERMCDRVGIIHNGRLIAFGAMEELSRQSGDNGSSLEDIFLHLTGSTGSEQVGRFLGSDV